VFYTFSLYNLQKKLKQRILKILLIKIDKKNSTNEGKLYQNTVLFFPKLKDTFLILGLYPYK